MTKENVEVKEKIEYATLAIRKGETLKRIRIYSIEKDIEIRDLVEIALKEYMDNHK